MMTHPYLYLNLHLHLHLLKNRPIALCGKSLKGIAMATVRNWPFGTESGQKLTDYLTTGPVSTMSRKDIRAAGFQKMKAGARFWEKPTLLFKSWKDFATESNFIPGSNKDFKSKLEAGGYRCHRTGPRGRHYEGIRLKASSSAEKWSDS